MTKKFSLLLALVLVPVGVAADEGMWTLDNFPAEIVLERYGVEIDQTWLDQTRLATTRIDGGCSGSFVSPNGLVLTNHHCVQRCAGQMSSAENPIAETGFLARATEDEVRCESEQLSVLVGIEEITAAVEQAVAGKPEAEANQERKQTLTRLEQACKEDAGAAGQNLFCESVALYNGGQYFLYKYKRYDDVRMVFLPETAVAAFGGDPDNFNYPRWCLDMAFLRVYEDGQPASTPEFLRWRRQGAAKGEPVFVAGHPGSTQRLLTVAELEHLRNTVLPPTIEHAAELRGRLIQYAKTGDEPRRIAQRLIQGVENGIKVRRNRLRSLLDAGLMASKRTEEAELKNLVGTDPELADAGGAWDEIAAALATYRTFRDPHRFIESGTAFSGTLFGYARTLVRAAAERQKPNEERLREYTEAALPRRQQRTLAARPIYPEFEEVQLSFSLEKMREHLGPDSRFVHQILGSESPDQVAHRLVSGTRLDDPAVRAELWEGGQAAIEASDDPLILLARAIDEDARALRQRYEDEVEAPMEAASEKIARARFAVYGTSTYPDATFTARLTFGAIEGWMEKGEKVEPFTQTARLFERTTGQDPFRLPPSWLQVRDELDMTTRFNTIANTDIIGGNSGSPMIDAGGRLVGLVFDGNIHSIAGAYWFDPEVNRTVAVHPEVILEALEVVYGADRLLAEIEVVEPQVEPMQLGGADLP